MSVIDLTYYANSTYVVPNDQPPSAISGTSAPSPYVVKANDDSKNFAAATAQFVQVNTGLQAGFKAGFKGTITFSGSATLNDVRVAGAANPWCDLRQTGVDTYDIVGTKP